MALDRFGLMISRYTPVRDRASKNSEVTCHSDCLTSLVPIVWWQMQALESHLDLVFRSASEKEDFI